MDPQSGKLVGIAKALLQINPKDIRASLKSLLPGFLVLFPGSFLIINRRSIARSVGKIFMTQKWDVQLSLVLVTVAILIGLLSSVLYEKDEIILQSAEIDVRAAKTVATSNVDATYAKMEFTDSSSLPPPASYQNCTSMSVIPADISGKRPATLDALGKHVQVPEIERIDYLSEYAAAPAQQIGINLQVSASTEMDAQPRADIILRTVAPTSCSIYYESNVSITERSRIISTASSTERPSTEKLLPSNTDAWEDSNFNTSNWNAEEKFYRSSFNGIDNFEMVETEFDDFCKFKVDSDKEKSKFDAFIAKFYENMRLQELASK